MITLYRFREGRILPIIVGLALAIVAIWSLVTTNPKVNNIIDRIDYLVFDWRLKSTLKNKIPADNPVVLIDIDDVSLKEQGRWPWPRNKMAKLVDELFDLGIAVVVFDILFPEKENNIGDIVLKKMSEKGLEKQLKKENYVKLSDAIYQDFNHDSIFAKTLKKGNTVLGIAFDTRERQSFGNLGLPVMTLFGRLANDLAIYSMDSYTTTIPELQDAATSKGFLTTIPDKDGLLRRSPLLIRYDDNIYPSLSLAAAQLYLGIDDLRLVVEKIGDQLTLEGIRLSNHIIPTDEHGQVLIPYLGKARTYPTIPATDVLNKRVHENFLKDKIALVGASALGLGDLKATPVQAVYPGMEVQASILGGILQGIFPYVPPWAPGVELTVVVGIGLPLCFILPLLSAAWLIVTTIMGISLLIGMNFLLWSLEGLAIPLTIPLLFIGSLMTFNVTYGFLTERYNRRHLKSMFGQYVAPEHIDEILKNPQATGFEGETREMTVLFSDIRDFTNLSEGLEVAELKHFLNEFLTEETNIIFSHAGTIDKYVGDMVMAFWGAPLHDEKHSQHAIEAGLHMQKVLIDFNENFKESGFPEVRIGIGINTGKMNVGDMGSKFRRNYTVLGDAVNLGSRLEMITKKYGVKIIVSETTYAAVPKDVFLFRKLDRIRVKGKLKSVTIYEPVCLQEDITKDLQNEVDAHHQALELYFTQQWAKALKQFQALLKTYQRQTLYNLYIERIKAFQETPLDEEWDGVYTFVEK